MIALKAIFLTWRIGLASAVIFAMTSTNGFVVPILLTWIAAYVAIDTVAVLREVAGRVGLALSSQSPSRDRSG